MRWPPDDLDEAPDPYIYNTVRPEALSPSSLFSRSEPSPATMERSLIPKARQLPPDDQVDFQWCNRNRLGIQWELQGLIKPVLPSVDYTTGRAEYSYGHGHVVIVEAAGWKGDTWRFGVFLEKTPNKYRVFLFASANYTERIISVKRTEFYIRDGPGFVRYGDMRLTEAEYERAIDAYLDKEVSDWPKCTYKIQREDLRPPPISPPIPTRDIVTVIRTADSPGEWLQGYRTPFPRDHEYLRAALLPRILDDDGDETGICCNCLHRQALSLPQCRLCNSAIHIG